MKLDIFKKWAVIALIFSVVGVSFYYVSMRKRTKADLGSCDNPEIALQETQKALSLVSVQLNIGMNSVLYVKEYELAKAKIFIQQ